MFNQPLTRLILGVMALCWMTMGIQAQASEPQTLNAGWLLEAARNTVLTSDPWKKAGCSVEVANTPADMRVYKEGQIEVVGSLERIPNSLKDIGAVTVEVYVAGELYMRFDPSPYLSVSVTTFVTSREIERGEVIGEEDVMEMDSDVRSLPTGDVFGSLEEIVGLAARVNIGSGRILQTNMLEPPTLVFRGENVTVRVPLGGAAVTLEGVALDSGALGDEIRVRNPDSGAILTAEVSGPGTALIRLFD